MIKIGDKVKAKFDLGDNQARGKKGHIYCLKGEVLVVKDILTENLTHPLRVSNLAKGRTMQEAVEAIRANKVRNAWQIKKVTA